MNRLFVLGGLGAALIAVGSAGMMFSEAGQLKGSVPYRRGLERTLADARAQALLGTPIEVGWMVNGTVSADRADLTVPLDGPTRAARLHIQAHVERSEWKIDVLTLGDLDLN